jgi:putative phage-type endonuclease
MPRAVAKLHAEFKGITATSASIIAGVNPWESPYSLYMRMTGQGEEREQTFPMWLGTQMEGIVIRAFSRETGLKCRRPHRAVDPAFWFTTDEFGFPMGALIDAWTLDPDKAGVEAKTASAYLSAEWEEDVPLHYFMQIQHQMACTGWSHFYAAAIVGNKYVQHRVERDDDLIALLTDKERDFYWNHLYEQIPPDVDGSEATGRAITARWGRSTPEYTEVINDPEVERLALVYNAQGKAVSKLKEERELTANRLKVVLEDRESLQSGSQMITWRTQPRTSIDTKLLRATFPLAAEACTTKSETRPLKVTEVKP